MDGNRTVKGETAARWALAALALAMLLSSMGVSIANVALPTLASAFSAPFQQVQWIVLTYLLSVTALVVSAGRLGDMLGHRRALLAGLALFTVASLLCAIAPSLWALIGARAVQGVGAAVLMAVTVALVRETVPRERTGSAMGLLGTMSAIGTALGPSLGGVLIAGAGWRAIFAIMVPLGILAFALAYLNLSARRAGEPVTEARTFDMPGTLLLAATLVAYALSMTAGDGFGRSALALLLAAAFGAVLFVFVESRVASPLIRLLALRNAALSASLVMNALVAVVMMTTLVVGPFYLALALGLGEAAVGLAMSVGPVISIFTGVPAGRIVDRAGAPLVAAAGLVAMAAGSFALATLPHLLGIVGYLAAIAILTPGYQLFQAANNTMVMMDVEEDRRGVISGLLGLSRNLGLVTGASAMGAIFFHATGSRDLSATGPEAVAGGMQVAFAVAGGLMLAALAVGFVSGTFAARED